MQNVDFFCHAFFKMFIQFIVKLKFFIVTTTHMCNNNKYREIYFEFVDNENFFIMFVFCSDTILKIEIEIFENF